MSLKQKQQLGEARASRRLSQGSNKENSNPSPSLAPPLSPKSAKIKTLQGRARAAEGLAFSLQQALKNTERREKTAKATILKLKQWVKEAEQDVQDAVIHGETEVRKVLKKKAADEQGWRRRLVEAERRVLDAEQYAAKSISELKDKLGVLRRVRGVLRLTRRQLDYHKQARERVRTGSRSVRHVQRMRAKSGRAYKVELRALARVLISCGCKQGRVGELMQDVARIFGVDLDRAMSCRTVRRVILEGLVAAQVQLGAEMKQTNDITMSSDSTSRRKLNYQSSHIHLRVPEKNPDGSVSLSSIPKSRFAGIASTVDHSTETSKNAWLALYNNITSTYNASPLGRRLGSLDLRLICRRLRGMCGDHANNEKALSNTFKEVKHEALLQDLGEERLRELDGQIDELRTLTQRLMGRKFDDAGGFDVYMRLSPEDKAAHDLACVHAMTRELGEEALNKLDEADRRLLTVWVWTGCCMHKDQNSFKGGNTHMTGYWKELGVPGPIRLANKETYDCDVLSEYSSLGSQVAGALSLRVAFTSSGSPSVYVPPTSDLRPPTSDLRFRPLCPYPPARILQVQLWLQAKCDAGTPVKRFDRTNKNRFQSHGGGSCELVVRRVVYREFLQAVKKLKQRPGWTNIELNVYNALDDGPTLTELCVLALYHIFFSVPYTRRVRVPEEVALNTISLGPLHAEIRDHCQKIIDDPDFILDFDDDKYELATFDGKPPFRDDVLAEIKKLHDCGKTPYLREMLVRFLQGAKSTWIRFCSEYALGGVIDGLNDSEKGAVWLPATNDRNEGGLGSYIGEMREFPTMALAIHNGMGMFRRNETQAFMDMWFEPEDHQYLMVTARNLDSAGLERERKRLQMEYNLRVLAEKDQKEAAVAEKAAEIQRRLDATVLISRVEDIFEKKMTRLQLQDQLEKLRNKWNTKTKTRIDIPKKSHIPKLADKQRALTTAFQEHLKLLASTPEEQSGASSGCQELVQDHFDEEDEEYGQLDEDAALS
ncbi:hypothetical protein FB45DRAFT_1017922 [Roridomyces roridus]|uniref:Uncharacterized protein n=1 Tax=Roridomyces roridus TaxID=1738132 RepID=A0AAD7CJH5_9AGAR|nr:hypothetical protein FB45DRAFT_1017922 [Roridomyces roridus]